MRNSEILTDHSPTAIKFSMERNFTSLLIKLLGDPKPGWKIQQAEGMVTIYTGIPTPFLNSVFLSPLDERNLEIQVTETIKFYKGKHVPFLCWIGPSSYSRGKLRELLSAHGMKELKHRRTGMAFDIRTLDEGKCAEAISNSNITIEPVRNLEELENWRRIVEKCLNYPPILIDVFFPTMTKALGDENLTAYLAYLDGIPVASSSRMYAAGVVGIFNVGTLPEYRGKGIATLMAQAILLDAKKREYEISTLIATEQGYNVYQRMGYQDYWEWQQYIWSPP